MPDEISLDVKLTYGASHFTLNVAGDHHRVLADLINFTFAHFVDDNTTFADQLSDEQRAEFLAHVAHTIGYDIAADINALLACESDSGLRHAYRQQQPE